MQLHNVIAHQIAKNQGEMEVVITHRDDDLEVTPQVTALLEHVRRLYNTKTGRGYGEFEPDRFLSLQLTELAEGRIDFVRFTHRALNELAEFMKAAVLATGGHVMFLAYEERAEEYMMIVMLKSVPGFTFNEVLELIGVEHLNLDRLHFAARINLTAWSEGRERYISFVKGRAAEITSYFKGFIGVTEYTDAGEDTKELVNVLANFCDEQELTNDEAHAVKARVFSYCSGKAAAGEPVYLEDLARVVNEANPEAFLEYANADDVQLRDGIEVDRTNLRRLVRYAGKDRHVVVSFSSEVYGNRVVYDRAQDVLIIHSPPGDLKEQLG